MRLVSAGGTDVGKKRKKNQDAYALMPEESVFVVADGMGGHAGGEYASRTCIDTICESIKRDRSANLDSVTSEDIVNSAIHRANSAIFNMAKESKDLAGMGTTVDLLLFDHDKLHIGHVGDSRVYLLKPGLIWQLTRDHSLVNEKLKAGLITRDQMSSDQNKNVITRSVGFESSVLIDVYARETQNDELYLTCSDGLSGLVEDSQILSIVDNFVFKQNKMEEAVKALIDAANKNGGDDNISVTLVHILE